MKAITVRQPWAWAIATGAKTVENRTRGTRYRGPLAIHAGAGWSKRGAGDSRILQLANLAAASARLRGIDGAAAYTATYVLPPFHHRGAIIATAELVDSHPDTGCCRPWGESSYEEAGGRTRTVLHHLVLEHTRPLTPPVPVRGALGLWTPGDDLLEQLRATA